MHCWLGTTRSWSDLLHTLTPSIQDYALRYKNFLAATPYDPARLKVSSDDCGAWPYGFASDGGDPISPCFILKINKIFGWKPQGFNKTFLADKEGWEKWTTAHDPMPEHLLEMARASEDALIFVDCQGENVLDREALAGNLKYYPDQKLSVKDFETYANQEGYQSPIFAIRIDGSAVPKGQLLHIECRFWHLEVVHSRKDRRGLVHFELLFEDDLRRLYDAGVLNEDELKAKGIILE